MFGLLAVMLSLLAALGCQDLSSQCQPQASLSNGCQQARSRCVGDVVIFASAFVF